jgi:hypothetical protein
VVYSVLYFFILLSVFGAEFNIQYVLTYLLGKTGFSIIIQCYRWELVIPINISVQGS